MALLGANVQLNDNFQVYYPTKELRFDSGGSTWTSANINNELRTDFYHMGPFPVSSPCTFLGYNQELVKQTILKQEAIFKDQIRELHRVYHKQRELMDEIRRTELHKQNARLETSWSSSALSSKNREKIFYSSNLPWSTSQSSFLFAESIQLPPAFAQEKSRQIFPAHASTVTEESLKDYTQPESTCRKVGKKILDLELPADEYIDSDEGEENVQFKLDLNVPFRLEVETAAKSNNLESPTNHMNNFLYDLSMRPKFGSQNFHNDVFNKRQDLEGSSHNQLKKCEWKSSGLNGGLLDSFDKDILLEKQSVSVDSLCKNMEQFDDLSSFHSSHQINQGPLTKTIFSSSESSARNGFLGEMGLPCLKELPVVKAKPNEESTISTQIESVILNPHMSSDLHSFHGFATEHFQNQAKNQGIEEIEKELPCVDVSDMREQIPSGEHLNKNEKKRKHEYLAGIIDLNSSMIEDENVAIDVDFHAPLSPENKECSPPRGESDENQLVTPFQFAEQEDPHVQEEQTRIAAEALVSISGFVAQKDIQMATCSSSESSANSPLNWFAAIVSTTVDHAENDNDTDFNSKVNGLDEFLSDEMDYFEFMTLNLTETEDQDCCFKSKGKTEQIGGSASPNQPRKSVRTYKGRWRKDFQSEILPSIASLSRYEVTEDLQIIESLVTADIHSEMGSIRNASRKVQSKGRRRSCSSAYNTKDTDLLLNLKQLTSITKLGIEKKGLISWGKTCKKRRGQRFRITNPRFLWS